MTTSAVIVWFKRDLRIYDHAPLVAAAASNLPVIPLYVFEPDYWQQPFSSARHWHFIHDCLTELSHDLTSIGQPLITRTGNILDVMDDIRQTTTIKAIYAHEETGGQWTYQRDLALHAYCNDHNILFSESPTNGVVRKLSNRDQWALIRNTRMKQPQLNAPSSLNPAPLIPSDPLPDKNHCQCGAPLTGLVQQGGRGEALKTLDSFLQNRAKHYMYRLSAPGPSERYCSRLSTHLAWGTISAKEVTQAIAARKKNLTAAESSFKRNLSAFSSRLAWRCHFIQKLEDQPEIETHCMHPAFEGLREDDWNETFFANWKDGKTGYPLIDACMRNLTYNGWITFRMRAMLTSFASYHLWLDWRKTGHYLAQLFTDFEPGIHYSQLQMQSGVTGINAVRMYNPIKQSLEHDPNGEFITAWVPELKNVPSQWIHEPWKMDSAMQQRVGCIIGQDYPAPIVEHQHAIKQARQKIKQASTSDNFKEQSKAVFNKLGSRRRSQTRSGSKGASNKSPKSSQMDLFNG